MVILKQFKKKNKSIQIFPFVMKDDYLIAVLTMMVTLSLKIRLELAFCKKTTDKMIFSHIDNYLCISYDATYRYISI